MDAYRARSRRNEPLAPPQVAGCTARRVAAPGRRALAIALASGIAIATLTLLEATAQAQPRQSSKGLREVTAVELFQGRRRHDPGHLAEAKRRAFVSSVLWELGLATAGVGVTLLVLDDGQEDRDQPTQLQAGCFRRMCGGVLRGFF